MEKKKLNKTTKSNLITYGMVLAAYLIVQGMIAGNLLSNLMQGLLVPLCVYIILALSLNLTVGILGLSRSRRPEKYRFFLPDLCVSVLSPVQHLQRQLWIHLQMQDFVSSLL